MSANLTVTDLFAGAGGSSTGMAAVPGVAIRMATNHWKLAVDSHNANHPTADHDVANVSEVDPSRYPRTDILWASPECTTWSQAGGRRRDYADQDALFDGVDGEGRFDSPLPDEAIVRSRSTMGDVIRFTRHHAYRAVIVENVVDIREWFLFGDWLAEMDRLGYRHREVYLNSMHAQGAGLPAPQSRDRLYVVFWRIGDRAPDLEKWVRPSAWCPRCEQTVRAVQAWKRPDRQRGRYRSQYVWRCPQVSCRNTILEPGVLPAAAAIDWTLPAERIGDRARPLAAKTLARIEAGLRRYARPITLEAAGHTFERRPGVRTRPVDAPLTVLHTTASKAVACPPLMVPAGGTWNDAAQPVGEPMRTRTTRDTDGLLVPPPLLIPAEGRDGKTAQPTTVPLRTQTGRNETGLLTVPFIAELRGGGSWARSVAEPMATVCASGNHHALVMRNNTARGDAGQMSTPVDEPLRTFTAAGHQSLIRWDHLLYGYDTGGLRTVAGVLPTQTSVEGDALLGPDIQVSDCTFRMLEPDEIRAGMAFPAGYLLLGNKRERVKQLGNAVTPPCARDLMAAVAEALTGDAIPEPRTAPLHPNGGTPA